MDRETGDNFTQCIEENAYSTDEIILTNATFFKVNTFFMLAFKGLVKSLDIPPDCINDRDESHRITLNGNITYNLYLTDPKLPFITHNKLLD